MDQKEMKDYLIDCVSKDENSKILVDGINVLFTQLEQYEKALGYYADSNKYYYARKDHPNSRLAEDGGHIAQKALLRDRYGRTVEEGETIKFRNSENTYTVINRNGTLGCYEEDEFIPLHLVLRNYEVLEKGRSNKKIVGKNIREVDYYCEDCNSRVKSGGRCQLNREGALTPCNTKESE